MGFPRLIVGAREVSAVGAFAEAQAMFLRPDARAVRELGAELREKDVGVVAHFYMDPELQGVLLACDHPHIHVSDSLLMADRAVAMAAAGAKRIICLGVDFMSENVRAMLDASGFDHVPVYRVSDRPIGCSLAEAAEAAAYDAYLDEAARTPRSLHVIYINTSLRVKARAQARVPTITCTSSNVVQTLLQAAAQIPDVHLWFGPDTYMGQNLAVLFERASDGATPRLHPEHDAASIARLRRRFRYFEQGACVVHHMFGAEVVRRLNRDHSDAYVTAHFEVPGEMFLLGLDAQRAGRGVVGSTSNILQFIESTMEQAGKSGRVGRVPFVLGTESGMVTSIVQRVQHALRAASSTELEAEIIFPVAAEAITRTDDAAFPIVPGAPSGEGCSPAGGCATCPFMKMNSLDSLRSVLAAIGTSSEARLAAYAPRTYAETIGGKSLAELGGEPILHMRAFTRDGRLPAALVDDVMSRCKR